MYAAAILVMEEVVLEAVLVMEVTAVLVSEVAVLAAATVMGDDTEIKVMRRTIDEGTIVKTAFHSPDHLQGISTAVDFGKRKIVQVPVALAALVANVVVGSINTSTSLMATKRKVGVLAVPILVRSVVPTIENIAFDNIEFFSFHFVKLKMKLHENKLN
mmetsp:Transcript_3640/g.5462  ORF Transcript_3640/g.5462 Transcript_3640/m.5462 type:complete len:159 (-) Transcript_3640:32-508(-)